MAQQGFPIQLHQLARGYREKLPRYMFRAIAKGLYDEARQFLKEYSAKLGGAFKTGGDQRVGKTFRVYTAGDSMNELEVVLFTRWEPAELYETGGTISPKSGGKLLVPINPKMFTSKGRLKRFYRDPNDPTKFNPAVLRDLGQVKLKNGMIMLVRGTKQVTTPGAARRSGVNVGGFRAFEPMFLLVPQTKRKAVLSFFESFRDWAATVNPGEAWQEAMDAFARDFAE